MFLEECKSFFNSQYLPSSDRSMGRRERRRLMKNNKFQQFIVAKDKGYHLETSPISKFGHCTVYGNFLDFYVGHKYF